MSRFATFDPEVKVYVPILREERGNKVEFDNSWIHPWL